MLVIILLVLVQLLLGMLIILRNRLHPERALLWLLFLLLIPLIGALLYYRFGVYPQQERKLRWHLSKGTRSSESRRMNGKFESTSKLSLMSRVVQLTKTSGFDLMPGHVMVLTDGQEKFRVLLEALRKSVAYIYMIYYIFRADEIGEDILDVLRQKSKSGVKVKILLDGVGSQHFPPRLLRELDLQGIEVAIFSPFRFPFITRRVNFRNHRKLVVIDGEAGFLGGINIGDEYLGRDPHYGFWRDTHLRLAGESVDDLKEIFEHDWLMATGRTLTSESNHSSDRTGEVSVQVVASGPDTETEIVHDVFLSAIALAQATVYLETPYLIPDISLLQVLRVGALSGIQITIVVQGVPDHKITYWATRSYYDELLEAGVKIYEYQKGILHAKVLVVDGVFSFVGSVNTDMRSFYDNFELGALLFSEIIASRLEADFKQDVADSRQIILSEFRQRALPERFTESLGRILAPIL